MAAEGTVAPARFNIVMRTKNRPLLLQRALDDVLAQSVSDWVLTVVNDGGSAGLVDALVNERAERFGGRVRVIHHDASVGMEEASNIGVRAVESTFVAIHDDDDTWHADFLSITGAWLQAQPSAVAVAVRTEIIWESIDGASVREQGRETFLPALVQVTLFDLMRFNTCVPISMLYRRAPLIEVGLFDGSLPVTGDWEANLRLAARGEIGFLSGPALAFWHQRPNEHGDAGNSVVALRDDHGRFDRLVRDRALREYVASEGAGLPLYLTRLLDDRFDELARRLDRLEAVAGDTAFRRAKSRVKRALGRG
ncbi:glycosyltransferase family 2 protein [Agromyces sp. CCNWLW203]